MAQRVRPSRIRSVQLNAATVADHEERIDSLEEWRSELLGAFRLGRLVLSSVGVLSALSAGISIYRSVTGH
jgi:hypothetical protein